MVDISDAPGSIRVCQNDQAGSLTTSLHHMRPKTINRTANYEFANPSNSLLNFHAQNHPSNHGENTEDYT